MYQQALERLGTDPAHTVAIGDRLDTDILGAVRAGLPSVLVLTGIARREDLATAPAQPTWVVADIRELTAELLAPATPGASRGLAVQPERSPGRPGAKCAQTKPRLPMSTKPWPPKVRLTGRACAGWWMSWTNGPV